MTKEKRETAQLTYFVVILIFVFLGGVSVYELAWYKMILGGFCFILTGMLMCGLAELADEEEEEDEDEEDREDYYA